MQNSVGLMKFQSSTSDKLQYETCKYKAPELSLSIASSSDSETVSSSLTIVSYARDLFMLSNGTKANYSPTFILDYFGFSLITKIK